MLNSYLKSQLAALLRHGLTALGAALVVHHVTQAQADSLTAMVDPQAVAGFIVAIGSLLWSMYHKHSVAGQLNGLKGGELLMNYQGANNATPTPPTTPPTVLPIALLFLSLVFLTGCTNFVTATGKYGVIVTLTSHQFGLIVQTSTTSDPYPKLILGSSTTSMQFMPTSLTNIVAPNYAFTVDDRVGSLNPFNFNGFYGFGSGQDATYEGSVNPTNTASSVTTQPVLAH